MGKRVAKGFGEWQSIRIRKDIVTVIRPLAALDSRSVQDYINVVLANWAIAMQDKPAANN
jgi:hypothetical protein